MKILYVAYSTEYEAGWGSRPDGFILTEEKSIIEAEIEKVFTQGSYECYWRYSSIDKVIRQYANIFAYPYWQETHSFFC